ncbi:MAG: N-acetylmuramoyl-L-alanine amidase [Selenomonadaceae bacterium]|nr:N-acetylmuramoyl-L-alanine amidase [Selenomonadaceae bacterium]MBR4696177.1 N-acetylmuramoyl-L-alanine amidase [Selenomonadaceae bacterium]
MDRREFLKCSVAAVLGLGFPFLLPASGEAAFSGAGGPTIYKRSLHFNGYARRSSTDSIIIHHSGLSVDKDSTVQEIHRAHQQGNGWAGIGYHYLIHKNGKIDQGRAPEQVGAHTWKHNGNTIGICVAGNFNLARPTASQINSLNMLVAWLCMQYRLNPTRKDVILGHCDLNSTDCPGKHLYPLLGDVRRYCRDFD